MVRSMISYSTVPVSLWMEALKTAIHVLNRVPSKSVSQTPYELWTGREPSLNYLRVWGCLAEAKVFNPNIGKLDPKKVSCHFIGYPEKSKGYRFYYPDRYTKFVEMRHAVFLEDKMIRGSMVPREINLEEKRVYVPIPMVQEPFFLTPVVVTPTVQDTVVTAPAVSSPVVPAATTPTVQDTVVSAPVVSSHTTMTHEHEEPVLQDPIELVAAHEEELQQPPMEDVPVVEAPRRSQRIRKPAIPDDYEVYVSEEVQMEEDPTSFEQAMRSAHSSKWLEAMEDEMRSMSSNKVWDLEEISKGAKTVGCK